MPPTAQTTVRQANGTEIVLSENDRIVKEVTIPCSSQRCASRHGQSSPVTFTFNDQDQFPETGDQFLSLILPERSPSNPQYPVPFCGPQCLKDFLVYQYLAPGPRVPENTENTENVQTPAASITDNLPEPLTMLDVTAGNLDFDPSPKFNSGDTVVIGGQPAQIESVSQADGFVEGENPQGPRVF